MTEAGKMINAALTIAGQQRAERNSIGEALLSALRDAMPWGLEVELPHGAKARLVKMNDNEDASQPYRQPIYPDGGPCAGPVPPPIGYSEWKMSFDFQIHGCDADHVEITMSITGGGGAC